MMPLESDRRTCQGGFHSFPSVRQHHGRIHHHLVVSYLTYSVLLPPFLNAFFGLFIGTIQAFVFTMLTIVYIAVQVE
jgi:hypothetical protein